MYKWNAADYMSTMLTGKELKEKLLVLPYYDESIRYKSAAERLVKLEDIYKIYIPSQMTSEIYSKLYLSMLRSLSRKGAKESIRQKYENYKGIKLQNGYKGIIGGSDSFSIIGNSGIGKTTSIARALEVITENRIIEIEEPYCKIIPCVTVACPFDCSVKGLLLEILRQVDEQIDSHYYATATKYNPTVDRLLGTVGQVSLNHIGLLIVDEIQNVIKHRAGEQLISFLTQLINISGVAIAMVGTPEVESFFERVDYMSRRSIGLRYGACEFDSYFRRFCEIMFHYQYVQQESELTEGIILWLYEHSGGMLANVVSIIHDTQESAILSGREILNIETLKDTFEKRMGMMKQHIKPIKLKDTTSKKEEVICLQKEEACQDDLSLVDILQKGKNEKLDMVELLKMNNISITEIAI